MDFWDGFHIEDTYIEKDRFYEIKTNVKRKRILSYFGLPNSEERIVHYKDTGIIIVFLDYWNDNSKIDLWENGKILHLRGTKEYDMENDITQLNVKDNALYFLDRNDIAVHLFWAEEKDKYRYGHVMIPQNMPYQIQEISKDGSLKYVWIFPLLPVDVSYKMDDKYSFYEANKIKGYIKKFVKKQVEEIILNDIEDTLMIEDINNLPFNMNSQVSESKDEKPKMKQKPKEINGKFVYNRDRNTAFHALQLADFKCEISNGHKSFIRKSTNQNYTEPHHLIPMAYSDKFDMSLDVEANIVSLCSTCHNHIHYGVGAKDLLINLYNQRIYRLMTVGIKISLEELLQMYSIK